MAAAQLLTSLLLNGLRQLLQRLQRQALMCLFLSIMAQRGTESLLA